MQILMYSTDLHLSGILRKLDCSLATDVSGHRIGPIFKGPAVLGLLDP